MLGERERIYKRFDQLSVEQLQNIEKIVFKTEEEEQTFIQQIIDYIKRKRNDRRNSKS